METGHRGGGFPCAKLAVHSAHDLLLDIGVRHSGLLVAGSPGRGQTSDRPREAVHTEGAP